MIKLQGWREILKIIIKSPQEKQRIAESVRVNPLTLTRWASGESQPRPDNLRSLLKVIPDQYLAVFAQSVSKECPDISIDLLARPSISPEIPSEFYARALSACADTPTPLYPQSYFDLVFQQAIEHLDPERRGMSVSLVRCVSPADSGRPVRSLRQVGGIGTPPWKRDLDQQTVFLGCESLSGFVVSNLSSSSVKSRHEQLQIYPAHWVSYEQSAAAFPVMHKTRVAGCLLFESVVVDYFTPVMLSLIKHYAHLIALGLEPEQFYDIQNIQLALMPDFAHQQPLLQDARTRLTRKRAESAKNHTFLTYSQAYELVWQEIEQELLQIPLTLVPD